MARAWLIDGKNIARKVKNAPLVTCKDIDWSAGASRECPNCSCRIDNSDVSVEWPGLPAGVKFDPSDIELLEHLACKVGDGSSKPHPFIDEFIPTLEMEGGICYTHPENLPGIKKDGSIVHFFNKTTNAYATGPRKRRKICGQHRVSKEHVRWHKTGKTKCIMENGEPKGCKKIMVLYRSIEKGSKPEKTGWVMHQYHLGSEEDEKEDEYVVSKIFYQQDYKHEKPENDHANDESDLVIARAGPRTPKTVTPNPPRVGKCDLSDIIEQPRHIPIEGEDINYTPKINIPCYGLDYEGSSTKWLAGESQAVEDLEVDDASLLCHEILDSFPSLNESSPQNLLVSSEIDQRNDPIVEVHNNSCGLFDLENLELDTPLILILRICSLVPRKA